MPSLENLNKKLGGNDFVVLGIDIEESRDTVQKMAEQYGLTYENLLDEKGEISSLYGVRSTPVKFIIDKKGNLAGVVIGYRDWDVKDVRSLIGLLSASD